MRGGCWVVWQSGWLWGSSERGACIEVTYIVMWVMRRMALGILNEITSLDCQAGPNPIEPIQCFIASNKYCPLCEVPWWPWLRIRDTWVRGMEKTLQSFLCPSCMSSVKWNATIGMSDTCIHVQYLLYCLSQPLNSAASLLPVFSMVEGANKIPEYWQPMGWPYVIVWNTGTLRCRMHVQLCQWMALTLPPCQPPCLSLWSSHWWSANKQVIEVKEIIDPQWVHSLNQELPLAKEKENPHVLVLGHDQTKRGSQQQGRSSCLKGAGCRWCCMRGSSSRRRWWGWGKGDQGVNWL